MADFKIRGVVPPVVTQAAFDAFLAKIPADVLVVLDEAYIEFATAPDTVSPRESTSVAGTTAM